MSKTKEGEIVMEDNEKKVERAGEVRSKTSGVTDTVRFWSSFSNYMIAYEDSNIKFKNHTLSFKSDDPKVKVVRATNTPYIHEVVNRPFEDEGQLARFNSFLSKLVYTGERGEPSKSGVIAVQSLFENGECNDIVSVGRLRVDQLIIRVLKTKSFKEGI